MRDHRSSLPALAIIVAIGCVFAAPPASGDAVTVRDAAGRTVTIKDARRIVSVGGAVTEILYALGLEQRIVAVDTTSLYPPRALTEKPNVGYMRQLSPEGVLGLGPSLVLAAEGSGPKETIAVLEAASVPFVQIPDHFTGAGIVEKIRLIAQATDAVARGECLAALVDGDLSALTRLRARITHPRKAVFILSFTNGRPMVAGRATAADGIMTLAGAVNAITGYDGYKLINDEAVIAAGPDAVLAMERASFRLDAQTVFAHSAFATTPAAAQKALISMEGLYLLGFGPRTARAARDLAIALYPSIEREPMPSDLATLAEGCRR
jgi:iron complex transport system substrate-binding protein